MLLLVVLLIASVGSRAFILRSTGYRAYKVAATKTTITNNNNENSSSISGSGNSKDVCKIKNIIKKNDKSTKLSKNINDTIFSKNFNTPYVWDPSDVGLLIEFAHNKDTVKFTKLLKTIASRDALTDVDQIASAISPHMISMIPYLTGQHISDWLWSLGRVGFTLSVKSYRDFTMTLIHRLCELSDVELNSRIVTTSIGGLARLRMRWYQLPQSCQNDLIKIVSKVALSLNDREVGNLLHSLSKICVPWSVLPKAAQLDLLESFVRESRYLVSQQGSMAIYSLGLMGLNINTVPPAVRDNIYTVALSVLNEATTVNKNTPVAIARPVTQQNSNVIYGLGKLGCTHDDMPTNVQNSIEKSILAVMNLMNDQEIANTIYSLGILGRNWYNNFNGATINVMEKNLITKIPRMIMQGVSNAVYGLCLMKLDYANSNPKLIDAIYNAVVRIYAEPGSRNSAHSADGSSTSFPARDGNGQSVANIVYSFGLCNADYSNFPEIVKEAIYNGIILYGGELSSQEISNLIYGLGCLRANFIDLPTNVRNCLVLNYERVCSDVNEQELCSTMNGFARMNAEWDIIPLSLQRAFIVSISALDKINNLCLACTVYSLGLLKAKWSSLPMKLKETLVKAACSTSLKEQTLSNVFYGFGLLEVDWNSIDEKYQRILLNNLNNPSALAEKKSQHVANTILGISKMNIPWSYLHGNFNNLTDNIQLAIQNAESYLSLEISTILFALSAMETAWSSLSTKTRLHMFKSFEENIDKMETIEAANTCYGLAIMAYDCHLAVYNAEKEGDVEEVERLSKLYDMDILWKLHDLLLKVWIRINSTPTESPDNIASCVDHYDQFGVYFEMMQNIPPCRDYAISKLGAIPRVTGPHPDIPSYLHAQIVKYLVESLTAKDQNYSIFNEFSGFQGVFPIDCAVYKNNELVAFVEIDGEFHYNPINQELRRKDRLKEKLYSLAYPNIPLFRVKNDQVTVIGYPDSGRVLASWILKLNAK